MNTAVAQPRSAVHDTRRGLRRLKVLVAIASYGTAQDHFLREVVAQYQDADMDFRVVVLSNMAKPVPGAEVLVGLPTRNTYSLPFAHRALFREHADEYDLFVYAEDDTLITARNIRAFLEVQQFLRDDEILGFLRSEIDLDGRACVVSANHHFRWLPGSTIIRGGYSLAQFSNQHSGCFIATRAQLSHALASGGFMVEPRADRYAMLETAASDIYTQCGLKRVLCLSRLNDFIVPHLANKYFSKMGIPLAEFVAQAQTLCELPESPVSTASLFNPETCAPGFRWSKDLYRPADKELLDLVPTTARRVLSVGATMGHDEIELQKRGFDVEVVPLDAVFGDTLRRRGLKVHAELIHDAMSPLESKGFDVVLAADALHLVAQPLEWLRATARLLSVGGEVVGSVSNTSSLYWAIRDWRAGRPRWVRPQFSATGAHPMSQGRLLRLSRACRLELVAVVPSLYYSPTLRRLPTRWLRGKLAPRLLYRICRGH